MRPECLMATAIVLCVQFSWGDLPFKVRNTLGELRTQQNAGEKAYRQFHEELKTEIDSQDLAVERRAELRLGEFQKCAERLFGAGPQPLPDSVAGASKMWVPRMRGSVAAVDAASRFNCGPGKTVSPSNGEYSEEGADFVFSERGGLAFSFKRRYASYNEFDCGFGKGWDHDFNSGIIFNADDVANAQRCVVFWQGHDIRFEKQNGVWFPEHGYFLSLEIAEDAVFLYTPLLARMEFQRAAEQKQGECRWRLSAIASRHDSWKANRIELVYLKGCDRLRSITGVRGERIDFAYDVTGHIVGINSRRKSVRYEYDSDCLVRVRFSPVSLSAQGGKRCELVISYDYVNVKGVPRVCRKQLEGQSYRLEVSYDEQGRAVRCGHVSDNAKQMWQMAYQPNETVVEMPEPSASLHYFWGGTTHASLPCRMEIPAQKAVVRYAFNEDYLPIEETDALGVKTVQDYDSENANPLLRGNLLSERRLTGSGSPIKWQEFGVRTSYEKEIALPVKVESYQIETNGCEEIVRRETLKYRRSDYSLIEKWETGGAEKGGVLMRFAYNRFGEVGLERDANDNVTIYEYAAALPDRIDFDFVQGSAANGGWLVRKIEDANGEQIKIACRALGARVLRNEIVRVKPCSLETRYAWDCDGNQIRERRGYNERLALYNEKGAALAEFSKGADLVLTEYLPDGRRNRVLSEFSPEERGDHLGRSVFFFDGRFKESAFEYDSLGQMSSRRMTDEPIDGVVPKEVFVRYPNGKIAEIINPSGVTRVDTYDLKTGLLVAQAMKGCTSDIPLGRIVERFPDGSVRVYEDKMGAVWTNRLDSFGRKYETISCIGTTKRVLKDVLDRVIETCEFDAKKVYSRSETSYSRENGFIESEKKWQSNDGKSGKWVEVKRFLYDDAGNEVGTKGVHEKSWTYSLYDGLNRRVATMDPVGGYSVIVYDNDSEVYTCSVSKRDDTGEEGLRQGSMRILDGAGRAVEAIPVDSNGKLVRDRGVKSVYNAIGQISRTESMGLTAKESEYNSLGWVVKETTSHLNAKQGENPIMVTTTFRADGKVIRRELCNTALALLGEKDNVQPTQVDAPQITKYFYDEYGRLQKTENPDGLILMSTFNEHSMPVQMAWTHHSTTDVLRKIEFAYSPLGQVQKLFDGIAKVALQEFSYDGAGMLTRAVDWNGGEEVTLESKYDTCGQKIENQTSLSGQVFPARRFDYDSAKGIAHAAWDGAMSGAFWRKETVQMDAAGRLRSITLDSDKEPVVEWTHMGQLTLRRKVRPSSIETEYAYTPLGELKYQQMRDFSKGEDVGRLDYAYGSQGQMQFASTQLTSIDNAGDYQFAAYSHFDDFRRLTGQNAEFAIPDQDGWTNEWNRVFGFSGRSLANQDTLRMRYDQANNIWVKYEGEEFKGNADEFGRMQSPRFISAAQPFPDGVPPDKQELASNREVSSAVFGNNGLAADVKEYDLLGNLVEFKGHYWDGTQKFPVKWRLQYDPLGRLTRMEATSDDDNENAVVKKGVLAGTLCFAYDAQNRRVMKCVVDRPTGLTTTNIAFTVYNGMRQGLVYKKDGDQLELVEEYLWGAGQRELIMASLTRAEKQVSSYPVRYYFQQDHGFNTVLVTKNEDGRCIPVSASSYLGFGENATVARIRNVRSSMGMRDESCAYNNKKDELLTATWIPGLRPQQFIELKMYDVRKLSAMTIWGAKGFPRDFVVYVLPEGVDSPDDESFDLGRWHHKNRDYLAAVVNNGYCQGYQKQEDSEYSPYKIQLGDRRGGKIVIAWDQVLDDNLEIKEIEVVCTPDNPSAIAFAGQWLDRETGLYYQVNRYRIAGSDKFISPDPLGFAAGDNLYAYANGNPLEWHDPDGRSASLLAAAGIAAGIGASVGAVIGGGTYALQCWINGEDFSWQEFGIRTLVGAIAGAVVGGTFGLAVPFFASMGVSAVANIFISSSVAGLTGGFSTGFSDTVLHGGELGNALKSGAIEGAWGAAGGAIGGAFVGRFGASFASTVAAGALSGGIVSGTRTTAETYLETGDMGESLSVGLKAGGMGSLGGAAIAGGAWGVGRGAGMIKPLKGYPEGLPDPRHKGVLVRTNAYDSQDDIPMLMRPFKKFLSYRDLSYDGVRGGPGKAVHHIKPVSLGGTTTKGNLLAMPVEQHSGPGNMHPGSYVNRQPYGTIFY